LIRIFIYGYLKLQHCVVHLGMKISFINYSFAYRTIITIGLISTILACQKLEKKTSNQVKADYNEIKATKVTINFNQAFIIKEIKYGQSMSDIYVSGTGFSNSTQILTFSKVAPLETFWVTDLDENGYEELYLITRSVGSGAKASVIGIASMDGKSYKTIFNPENDRSFKEKLVYLEGYQGHDSIFIEQNKLYRQFPVSETSSTSKSEEKQYRLITYRLVLYNKSYSLQVDTFLNQALQP